ncbi:MAG: hypothetical protein KGZ93_03820 [Actinobacteria bacterium]|nr:hypothetical protein [Actinomycetota bacterium]
MSTASTVLAYTGKIQPNLRHTSVTSILKKALDWLAPEEQPASGVIICLEESMPVSASAVQGLKKVMEWKDIGTTTARISQQEKLLLEKMYDLRGGTEVMGLIEKQPFLSTLLIDAYRKVLSYFPEAHRYLDVIRDPESPEGSRLALYIATTLAPEEAVERLEQFDEDWWLDTIDNTRGKLIIDVEV